MSRSLHYSGLLLANIAAQAAAQTCYLPNGTIDSSPAILVCDNTSDASGCCWSGDMCTTNGFCKNGKDDLYNDFYWRDSCTDSSWTSPKCASYCLNDEADPTGYWRVLACSETTYCCAYAMDINISCCSDSTRVFEAGIAAYLSGPRIQTAAFPVSSDVPVPSSTTKTKLTSSTVPLPTKNAPRPTNNDLGTGAKAGIGIGAAIGGIALLGALGFALLRRRKRTRYDAVNQNSLVVTEPVDYKPSYQATDSMIETEPVKQTPVEMPATSRRSELP